jgi:hypothetical protein
MVLPDAVFLKNITSMADKSNELDNDQPPERLQSINFGTVHSYTFIHTYIHACIHRIDLKVCRSGSIVCSKA